jgi:hypothetical protein
MFLHLDIKIDSSAILCWWMISRFIQFGTNQQCHCGSSDCRGLLGKPIKQPKRCTDAKALTSNALPQSLKKSQLRGDLSLQHSITVMLFWLHRITLCKKALCWVPLGIDFPHRILIDTDVWLCILWVQIDHLIRQRKSSTFEARDHGGQVLYIHTLTMQGLDMFVILAFSSSQLLGYSKNTENS